MFNSADTAAIVRPAAMKISIIKLIQTHVRTALYFTIFKGKMQVVLPTNNIK